MKEIVLNETQLNEIVEKIANQLNLYYQNTKEPIYFVCVLKGASVFMNDLIKKINFPLIIDYIQVSSYDGTSSTGVIHLKKDISEDITNKDVVIIEDIVDSGLTLKYLKDYINIKHHPRSIKICCLLNKKMARKITLDVDFVGYKLVDNKFLIGYGLDYNELLRNIPYIFVPTEEDLKTYDEVLKKN